MTTPLPPFVNEPVLELRRAPVRAELVDALAARMRQPRQRRAVGSRAQAAVGA